MGRTSDRTELAGADAIQIGRPRRTVTPENARTHGSCISQPETAPIGTMVPAIEIDNLRGVAATAAHDAIIGRSECGLPTPHRRERHWPGRNLSWDDLNLVFALTDAMAVVDNGEDMLRSGLESRAGLDARDDEELIE